MVRDSSRFRLLGRLAGNGPYYPEKEIQGAAIYPVRRAEAHYAPRRPRFSIGDRQECLPDDGCVGPRSAGALVELGQTGATTSTSPLSGRPRK